MNIASQVRSNGDMDIITYNAVVIDTCAGVDNAALSDLCIRVDYCIGHNDASTVDFNPTANHSSGVNKRCDDAADFVLDFSPYPCIPYRDNKTATIG